MAAADKHGPIRLRSLRAAKKYWFKEFKNLDGEGRGTKSQIKSQYHLNTILEFYTKIPMILTSHNLSSKGLFQYLY